MVECDRCFKYDQRRREEEKLLPAPWYCPNCRRENEASASKTPNEHEDVRE
jgi:hypothetical protein